MRHSVSLHPSGEGGDKQSGDQKAEGRTLRGKRGAKRQGFYPIPRPTVSPSSVAIPVLTVTSSEGLNILLERRKRFSIVSFSDCNFFKKDFFAPLENEEKNEPFIWFGVFVEHLDVRFPFGHALKSHWLKRKNNLRRRIKKARFQLVLILQKYHHFLLT